MESPFTIALKALRKLHAKAFGGHTLPPLQRETDPEKASEMIYGLLVQDKPCMIARFGSTELSALVNYIGVNSKKHSAWNYIIGKQPEWWWNENIMRQMQEWSGFFPPTPENMQQFGDLMMNDMKELDLLGSWVDNEYFFANHLPSRIPKVSLIMIEPYWASNPWSRALENKKVLVVHPFASLIESQYQNKRKQLFHDERVLPPFQLKLIQAVQTLGGENSNFTNWFDALDYMKHQMDSIEYDIALIGCGAYGFPLAAHAKRTGHMAVHMGGALQLLFGIKGKRWENPDYGMKSLGKRGMYLNLFNDAWVYPDAGTKPTNAHEVENGCYW